MAGRAGVSGSSRALHIVTLGRMRILVNGQEAPGTAARPLRLAVLARIATASVVTRDQLLGTFWPERSEQRARHALSQVLHKLRRDLSHDCIVATGEVLHLNECVAVDAREFDAAVQQREYDVALKLYGGRFLEGLRLRGASEFELWLDGQRRRLGGLYAEACRSCARQLETSGDADGALVVLARWCEEEPVEAAPHLERIELLLRCGRPEAARRLEREFLERLRIEELEPGPEFAPRLRAAFSTAAAADPKASARAAENLRAGPRTPGQEGAAPRDRVLVVPFENLTGDPRLDALGRLAADWIGEGLDRAALCTVVPLVDTLRLMEAGSPGDQPDDLVAVGRNAGRAARAGTLVAGSYAGAPAGLELRAQVIDLVSGELVGAIEPVCAPAEGGGVAGLATVRERVLGLLAAALDQELVQLPSSPALGIVPPTYSAYRAYSAGLECFLSQDFAGSLPWFREAVILDPKFTRPLLLTAAAHMKLGQWEQVAELIAAIRSMRERLSPYEFISLRYYDALLRGDRIAAYEQARNEWRRFPGSIVQFLAGVEALGVNRPAEAARVVAGLDSGRGWLRNFRDHWDIRTAAHHMLGDHETELELARQARAAFPGSIHMLALEARALAALGLAAELDECLGLASELPPQADWSWGRVLLATAAELRAHGQASASVSVAERAVVAIEVDAVPGPFGAAARGDVAHALCLAERWSEAEPTVAALASQFPQNVDYQGRLAALAARRGDRAGAERGDRMLQQLNRPFLFGRETAWRARIAALLGDADRAIRLLIRAFAEGQPHGLGLHTDPDLEGIRAHEAFQRLLRPKG